MADILVVGGTGFIGEYVQRELSGRDVAVIDASTPRPEVEAQIENAARILWLVRPQGGLLEGLSSRLKNSKKLQRFVFASTVLLYGDSPAPQSEDAPLFPSNEYERCKLGEEELLRHVFSGSPEKLVIARLANVYGDTKNTGVVAKLLTSIRDGTDFTMNGDGARVRDYIYVADVARILAKLLFADVHGTYNVSTSIGSSLQQLVAQVAEVTEKKIRIVHSPASSEKRSIIGDNAKLTRAFGAPSLMPLAKGLKKTSERYGIT